MTKNSQYIIGLIMIVFSGYQLTIAEYWEFALYISAGLAFIVMGMNKNEVFPEHKKLMIILSWVFIFIAGFLLLFLARTDY